LGSSPSSSSDDILVSLKDCSFKFGGAQSIQLRTGRVEANGLTIDAAGSTPTTLFESAVSANVNAVVENSNLSDEGFTNLLSQSAAASGSILFRRLKLPGSVTLSIGTIPGPGGIEADFEDVASSDTNIQFARRVWAGDILQEQTIVRTGGATQSDGNTYSWEMQGGANASLLYPLESRELAVWNNTVGSAITATIEFVWDSVTNAQDDEIWAEWAYKGTSGFPQGTVISDRVASVIATPADQTDSSVTWTTTGLTNPNTQKLVSPSFTPQEAGYIFAKVFVARNSTFFVDPVITLA
jgi:hypothetical protein